MKKLYLSVLISLSLTGCQVVSDTLATVNGALNTVNGALNSVAL